MTIGKQICFFCNQKIMIQKQHGKILCFLGKNLDVHIAQYKSEARKTKINLIKKTAHVFNIDPWQLTCQTQTAT